jgi:magnesium chelatase family protein
LFGINAQPIDVEVDLYPSGSARDFVTVGMPDTAVRESRERIKSALLNSGLGYPTKTVTINLAPANVRKEGAGFDLPMAMGILGAMGHLPRAEDHFFVGELSLDGGLRPVRGALSIAVCVRESGVRNLVLPRFPDWPGQKFVHKPVDGAIAVNRRFRAACKWVSPTAGVRFSTT